jgi:hypothetical protein
MHSKPLTKIQQGWLDHINHATAQKLSMAAYAKQNSLALKSFYNARTSLMKKGVLLSTSSNALIPLLITPISTPTVTTSCRITLCNGVILELEDVDITELLNRVSQV